MSQRRRQTRLLSLRFTGPPPPPRLCGPGPARLESPPRARLPAPRSGHHASAPSGAPPPPPAAPRAQLREPGRRRRAGEGARGGLGPARQHLLLLRLQLCSPGRIFWPRGAPNPAWRLEPEPRGGPRPRPALSTCATRAAPREAARALGARRRADCAPPGLVSARRRGCARAPRTPAARAPAQSPTPLTTPDARSRARAHHGPPPPTPHSFAVPQLRSGRAHPGALSHPGSRARGEPSLSWPRVAAAVVTRGLGTDCSASDPCRPEEGRNCCWHLF